MAICNRPLLALLYLDWIMCKRKELNCFTPRNAIFLKAPQVVPSKGIVPQCKVTKCGTMASGCCDCASIFVIKGCGNHKKIAIKSENIHVPI